MEIDVTFVSEKNPDALHFLETNHRPAIMCADMTDRRVTDTGQVVTKKLDGQEVTMPKGLGAYALGFPCTPWSTRGQGLGFQDKNAAPFTLGVATIRALKPKTFTLECVEGMSVRRTSELETTVQSPSVPGSTDLDVAVKEVVSHLGDLYIIFVYRRMQPTRFGYPCLRPRFYIGGVCRQTVSTNYSQEEAQADMFRIYRAFVTHYLA